MHLEQSIAQALRHIRDPFLQLNAEEMQLKFNLEQETSTPQLELFAPFPSAFLQKSYLPLLQDALPIEVSLTTGIRAHKTQLAGKGLRGVKNTIAIASGKGGVGKSTLTVNLATALARCGARVGILDADIYGPSIPLMLGQASQPAIEEEYYLPIEAHGVQAMSIGYLTQGEPALLWRGPMLAKSLLQLIELTRWDNLDYLFIDLPPGTGDIPLSLVQKIPLSGAVIVTTPQQVATLDAEKALKMFRQTQIDVLGLIENMSLHTCSQCGHQDAIFSQGGAEALCQNYATPLLGQLPLDTQIRRHCDEGSPSAAQGEAPLAMALIKMALKLAIELGKKPLNYADKFPNIIVE